MSLKRVKVIAKGPLSFFGPSKHNIINRTKPKGRSIFFGFSCLQRLQPQFFDILQQIGC